MRTLIAFLFTAVLLASCSVARLPVVKGVEDVKMNRMTKDSVYVDLGLRINNPGTWGYRVKKVDVSISMNNKPVGFIKGKLPFKLITKGDRVYNITAGIGTSAVLNMGSDILNVLGGKQVNMKLEGTIKMRWFIFSKKIKLDSSKDIKLPRLLGKN